MRQYYTLIGLKDGLGLVLLIFMISGCASYIAMETPQTLPEGQINLAFAGVKAEDDEQTTRGFGVLKGRLGTKKPVDFGARLDVPYFTVMVDAKYQLLQTEKHGLDLAFLVGTGTPLFYFQAILGRQLGPFQVYSSYRYQFVNIKPDLLGELLIDDEPEFNIQQGFAGIRLDFMKSLFCQGEGGYMWKQEIYMIGVGCGIIFSNL